MTDVFYRPDPNNPRKLTPEEKARLDAMTDEEITAAALSDPDNPPLTDEELEWMRTTLAARRVREKLGLTQKQFAERYQISYGRLRDLEQGRTVREDTALLAYLRVIDREPEAVARALGLDAA
jgi:putative transcriptional regulator